MKKYDKASHIKVGVVGYGGAFNMGKIHLQDMRQVGMTPVAVAEVDPARREVATHDFPGIETYGSVEAMLKESPVDLIVLITPHHTHASLALQCLRAGRHVVSEKPLAITTREVDAMIAAAGKADRMLSCYHNRHWDGRILQAIDLINKKKTIGEVVRIECHMGGYAHPGDWWRSNRRISGGILYDWGVHLLEYSLQLLDAPLVEVSGYAHEGFWASQTQWKKDTNEDEGFVVVRFQGGQWLTLGVTNIDSKGKEGWVEITGTKGTLLLDQAHCTLHQQQKDGAKVTTQFKNPPDQWHRYYENVRDHLVKGTPLVITAEWSRRLIHILDLAGQSTRKGSAMKTRYP